MISLKRSRKDGKLQKNRFILKVGYWVFHMGLKELTRLRADLNEALRKPRKGQRRTR